MKNVLKGILIAFGIIFLLLVGGCTLTLLIVGTATDEVVTEVGTATDEVVTEIQEESNTQSDIVDQVASQMEWVLVEDEFGFKTLESVIVNDTETKIDYVEFDVKFIKDGVTVETDWTNAADIEPGESRKVEFMLVPDDYDSFEVTATSSALD